MQQYHGILFIIFLWGCYYFFERIKDGKRKKRIYPTFLISIGIFITIFFSFIKPKTLLFLIPVLAIAIYISIRRTAFCTSCGKSIYNYIFFPGFPKVAVCPRCGEKIE